MPKFIEVTGADTGLKYKLNTDYIVYVFPVTDGSFIKLEETSSPSLSVTESVTQIMEMINV